MTTPTHTLGEDSASDHDQLDLVRAVNRGRILGLAAELGTVSCPTLAARAGLSRQTVYLIAAELERAGVLVGDGEGRSGRGRRPQLLRYEPRSWGAIGVEMRDREACAVLTDLSGAVVQRRAVPVCGTTPAQVAAAVEAVAGELRSTLPAGRVLGIGAALPGLIDVERGLVRMSVLYGWSEVPFAALLRERTGLQAYVASRPAAAALGEARAGAVRGAAAWCTCSPAPTWGSGSPSTASSIRGPPPAPASWGTSRSCPTARRAPAATVAASTRWRREARCWRGHGP